MNFFETLIRPDKEEKDARGDVVKAANLLQIGEFQFLQIAYKEWHDEELPKRLMDDLFKVYMFRGDVPPWASHYARTIFERERKGRLDDREARYHRYDYEFQPDMQNGVRKFWIATAVIVLSLGGGLLLADFSTRPGGGSIFPPYFDQRDSGPKVR